MSLGGLGLQEVLFIVVVIIAVLSFIRRKRNE